ncbi:MAG TPA: LL-diaminopimelate aminotransferase [Nitrospirae bacterium]|nr:LL-diaminopimelate aminotransferase [bacterium BMS3Abin10]GBE38036.1 LL-diaminopimelate aminotransferase [bacterium BMS3Bbin08]HDH51714.1 LL-diaminopimelate aminotransferase [Nitrospirota bacterium]HDK16977.1 LL-diaminopimelate aminotransferase [Nitrospirota bacterium]HDK81074.1 LL-diaminopimelate aminotransferase [Nitrospirota bacterium]
MSRKKSFELAKRVKDLPPYLFATIDKMKQKAINRGIDLIDLSVGDPDLPTPKHIVERMKKAVQKPAHHRYPSYEGMLSFRQAAAGWYKKRFRVSLDPETEVLSLIGSKEGIGHLPLAFLNPGDVVLVPSPGYPVYPVATLFAGAKSHIMPLVEKNDFLPDLKAIPKNILKKARLMFLNYPNNPTAAVAGRKFYEEVIKFAGKNNIIVCHDAAYSEIYYDNRRPMSFLQVPGAGDVGIEVHSLSKTYNMTGWRIGFAAGNAKVIAGLGKIKSNLDSGIFQAVQEAGIEALKTKEPVLRKLRDTYQERRDILYSGLKDLGLGVKKPKATFYLWTKVPQGYDSASFVRHLLNRAGVLITPGNGFGSSGEGYVRFALTVPTKRIRQAIRRIKKVL